MNPSSTPPAPGLPPKSGTCAGDPQAQVPDFGLRSPRRRSPRLIAVIAAFVALALVGAACGDDEESSTAGDGEVRDVTVMLNWTPNAHHAGLYLAEANGWFDEAGIDLTIIEPALDVGVEAAVADGAADIGFAQAESILPARAAGVDVVAVATLLPVNDSVLMGLAADGVDGPGSLAGLTYGGFGGALETELISALVECGGGDPADVTFVEVGNVDYLAGIEQDRFDVVWVFEGWDALRASELAGADIATIAFEDNLDCIPNWYTPLALTSQALIDEDPELVSDFLEVMSRGYDEVVADPASGAEALTEAVPEADAELVSLAVDYYAPRFITGDRFGEMDAETWNGFAEFLVGAGILEELGDVDAAWTNDLLPEAG